MPFSRRNASAFFTNMRVIAIIWVVFGVAIIVLFLPFALTKPPPPYEDRERRSEPGYVIDRVSVRAAVASDGSMAVSERRTLSIAGAVPEFVWTFDLRPWQRLEIDRVASDLGTFKRVATGMLPQGCYAVEQSGTTVTLRVRTGMNEMTRTFVVDYAVLGAARRYDDASELLWQFVGGEWDRPTEQLAIEVKLPQELVVAVPGTETSLEGVEAWVEGAAEAQAHAVGKHVLADADPLSAETAVDLHALFPARALDDSAAAEGPRLQAALEEKRLWAERADQILAERADRRRAWRSATTVIGALTPLAGLIFFVVMVRYRGNGYRWSLRPGSAFDVPAHLPPAEVAFLWEPAALATRGVNATLLDLVDRKVLTLKPTGAVDVQGRAPGYTLTVDRRRMEGLAPFESDFVRLVFDFLTHRDSLTVAELRELARENPGEMRRGLREFCEAVVAMGRRDGLDRRYHSRAAFVVRVGGAVVIAVAVATAIIGGQPLLVAGAAAGALMLVLAGRAMWRPSKQGVELYRRYRALRAFLVASGGMKERAAGAVVVWERYLVLAEALGIADEVSRSLGIAIPRIPEGLPGDPFVELRESWFWDDLGV